MNINRDYLLILDVKSGNLTVPTMYFINTDRGTSNIYLQLIVKNTDIKVSPLENATNYKVKANIVKSGGIIKFIEGVLVNEEDAIYEFNLPVDCINLSGAYRIEFEVSADVGEKQESITSFSTKYYVKRSILAEINEEIEDGDDYPLIVKLLAKIEELEKDSETRWIAENERIANEELRVQAESERLARYTLAEEKEAQRVIDEEARINAENERLAKEEERIAKEIDRVAKETERLNEEEIRKGSEITRVLNETTRVTNEEARVEAENIRLPKYLEAEEKEQARLIAEEERIANEELRVSNENDRKTAEAIRDSKEADRLNSEVFRLTNEVNRLENEKLRTNNEATRINSELTRVDNERNRVVAEKSRANSEDIRKTNENNRKIYEANREKAEQLRESNEVIRQEGYELMREQINNIEISGGYTHPSTHPASMIIGLSDVATSGSYNDLTNKPTIPEQFVLPIANQNTLGGIKVGAGLSITADGILSATGGGTADSIEWANVVGKPTFATVATSGDYNDLTNRPFVVLPSDTTPVDLYNLEKGIYLLENEIALEVTQSAIYDGIFDTTLFPGALLLSTGDGLLAELATGIYYTLESDGSLIEMGSTISFAPDILNNLSDGIAASTNAVKDYVDANKFSGNYNDLTNKPTIPTVTNDLTNGLKSNYDTAYTHSQSAHAPSNAQKNSDITKAEIEAKLTGNITTHTHSQYLTEHQSLDGYAKTADLSTVATSGSYNDLSNKPTIPTIPSSLPANGGNADTVGGYTIWTGTQTEYDALGTYSDTTIYMIKEG